MFFFQKKFEEEEEGSRFNAANFPRHPRIFLQFTAMCTTELPGILSEISKLEIIFIHLKYTLYAIKFEYRSN